MTAFDIITSSRNPRVVEARKLRQRKHRVRQGRFLVEGGQLLWMALDAGFEVVEVYTSSPPDRESSTDELLSKLKESGSSLLQVTPSILTSMSTRSGREPLIGVVTHQILSLREINIGKLALVLVLDRLQDCGNVGTLIRTADAAGASGVILLEPCADATDPRSVRSSMGSIFNLPVVSVEDANTLKNWLDANGLAAVGADAHKGVFWGPDSEGAVLQDRIALCLGNEAHGFSPDMDALIGTRIRLPMYGKADSLNVAVAGGILMYLWRKERNGILE
jgi:TrmH family RNA methyltransferase